MHKTLIIGAGGVGGAVAHKCAQNNHVLGDICLASRTVSKCERIVADVEQRGSLRDPARGIDYAEVDASDRAAIEALIRKFSATIVINVCSPYCNAEIMQACLSAGAHYLDTAVYEQEADINVAPPWYGNYEWRQRERFAQANLTGILGIGFDPGAVNAFCAHARKHLFDDIESIDIMDVNAGSHGRFFATNFDPEINLREVMEEALYWEDNRWQQVPPHSKSRTYDFPVVGPHTVYCMGHDELHSLSANIPARRIEFWMGFDERYISTFNVLNKIGLLSNEPVSVDGVQVQPIKLLKALLPEPSELAVNYTGKTCIGTLIQGRRDGERKEVFIYNICDHEESYAEIGTQAIAYTTAVPVVIAARLIAQGSWDVRRLVNVEELDPDPFMALMPELGLPWAVRENGKDS